ncbi:probable WRKY transcription factor 27 isoform X1 [Cucurbita pepo subsp. pepo]|uniref:probable WRKY transcription factor 27 isoform X1 n=1 Tax=Cucurbita pepo subsp. pepo TaxID=3664 RepID=UPI000C9D3A80|nr:probable WRKY transcription factor 27 isoform X1 [Cucurbita pepo subsp. pepo]
MAAGNNDWDLSAVVRSCNSAAYRTTPTATAATETDLSCLASLTFDDDPNDVAFSFPDILQPQQQEQQQHNGFDELHQAICFLPNSLTAAVTIAPEIPTATTNRYFQEEFTPILPQPDPVEAAETAAALQNQHHHQIQPSFPPEFPNSSMVQSNIPKSRKRKNQQKRTVCHVTADNLSTDMWAWRKYGQKPIKGSPYPRNYYRCSSSKGCGARKQVERSNADPESFIITYTGEHIHPRPTHRNCLAGSSRNRPLSSVTNKNPTGDPNQSLITTALVGSGSSPADSPMTPFNDDYGGGDEKEGEMFEDMAIDSDDDYDDILIPNLMVRDEIFAGFDEIRRRRPP